VEKARKACRDIFTLDGSIDRTSLQRYVDWAARKKYCPPGLEAAQIIDTRFLDRIASGGARGTS
jgi:hypothetical protein